MSECPQHLLIGPHFPDGEFQESVKAYGARYYEEWVPAFEDEETGEQYEGYVAHMVMKEQPLPDGRIAMYHLTLGSAERSSMHPTILEHEMKLLDAGLARVVEENT